ncbi:MAG: glycosyl transferase family 1, partial [Bacteroidota bacterium]
SDEIVPGKVFEYIGAQRPIIALAPEGAVAGVVRETNSGIVVHNQDIPGIKAAFLECYGNFLYHKKKFSPNRQAMRKYERREVTHRLAELLDYLQSQRESRH